MSHSEAIYEHLKASEIEFKVNQNATGSALMHITKRLKYKTAATHIKVYMHTLATAHYSD